MNVVRYLMVLVSLLTLAACGGGGSGGSESSANAPRPSVAPSTSASPTPIPSPTPLPSPPSQSPPPPSPTPGPVAEITRLPGYRIGTFVDSAVSGLFYQTESTSGYTDSNGRFNYRPGETVRFSIGQVDLGAAPASGTVTPLDLSTGTDETMYAIINRVRLLLTLDQDDNTQNGIQIAPSAHNAEATLTFEDAWQTFAMNAILAFDDEIGDTLSVIDPQTAYAHLTETYQNALAPERVLKAESDEEVDARALIANLLGSSTTGAIVDQSQGCFDANEELDDYITQGFDPALGRPAFNFYLNVDSDNPCTDTNNSRQRTEIKVATDSPAFLKGDRGEWHHYRWLMHLPRGFVVSRRFTHFFNLGAVGENSRMPLLTVTGRASDPDRLEILHTIGDSGTTTRLAELSLERAWNRWLDVDVRIFYDAPDGYLEMTISDPVSDQILLELTESNIPMWREGVDYHRAKWGIFRDLRDEDAPFRDEVAKFADICLAEALGVCASPDDAAAGLPPLPPVATPTPQPSAKPAPTATPAPTPTPTATPTPTIPQARYVVRNRESGRVLSVFNGGKRIDVNILTSPEADTAWQRWDLQITARGYKFVSQNSGKVMTLEVFEDGENNVLQKRNRTVRKREWRIKPAGDGYYQILSAFNGRALNEDSADNFNVNALPNAAEFAQQWSFELVIDE